MAINGFNRALTIGGAIVLLFWVVAFALWWFS
jgi:hypothetical protein